MIDYVKTCFLSYLDDLLFIVKVAVCPTMTLLRELEDELT